MIEIQMLIGEPRNVVVEESKKYRNSKEWAP